MRTPFPALILSLALCASAAWGQTSPVAPPTTVPIAPPPGGPIEPAVPATTPTTPATGTTRPADATSIPVPRKTRVAMIRLSDTLIERPVGFSLSLTTLLSGGTSPTLSELSATLRQATRDESIGGVVLDLTSFSLSLPHAQELGPLLSGLRKAGKRVAVYASDYDTHTYLLASHADTLIMPENGEIMIPGTGMQVLFFAGTLEKLRLSADFIQVGQFKGASEPFTRKTASPEYRAQIDRLVESMYGQIVSTIAANRPNLTENQVKSIIDEAWLTGRRAKSLGLIDQTMTRDQVDAWIDAQFPAGANQLADYGQPGKSSVNLESPLAIFSLLGSSSKPRPSAGPAIGVLYATGEIVADSPATLDSPDYVTPGTIRKAIQTFLDDSAVRAIVLRVDSPGGSASASDEIWSILKEADKKKPVTVSMGEMAASGGYYIACAGRSIMADPATLTGSIGVVGGKLVAKDLLDWAGVNIESISRGAHAQMHSILRPFNDEERVFFRKQMEEIYEVFTSRVTAARGRKIARLEDVAQGRLFTGGEARQVGLVDEIGTLQDAIVAAARSAGLGETYNIRILPEPKSFSEILSEGILADVRSPLNGPLIINGASPDALSAILDTLPAEVRRPTGRALRMLRILQDENVLMALPPGLVPMYGPQR